MNYLSPEQLNLLKALSYIPKMEIKYLSDEQIKICEHLESLGYVYIEKFSSGVNYAGVKRPTELLSVSITEGGKAFLTTISIDNIRYKQPYRLSIISTVIAGIAILLSIVSLYLQLR